MVYSRDGKRGGGDGMTEPKNCEEVPGWDTKNCCTSCHDDWAIYGFDPISLEINGEEYHVCCECSNWYNETHKEEQ